MAEVGIITCEPNPPGIDLERMRKLAASKPTLLRRSRPREVINPFTRAPVLHEPADTDFEIVADGVVIGAISVSLDDDNELTVWAPDEHVLAAELVAAAIADELGATYTSLSED